MKSWTVLAAALLILAHGAHAQTAPAYNVVEPKAPAKAKPAVRKRAAKANAKVEAAAAPKPPVLAANEAPLKPSGPCVIKPVMSDQDLVNCGARPQPH